MKMRSPHGASCAGKASRPRHIAVGGDSAGGNLTLGLINRLRAAGEELPGLRLAGLAVDRPHHVRRTLVTKDAVDPLIHKAYLAELADAYAPPPIDRRDPLISPLFADLRGFPPVLIQVGSAETLLADATRLAEAAGVADVAVRCEIWPHMIHAWPVWNAALEDGRRALAYAGQFIRAHIRVSTLATRPLAASQSPELRFWRFCPESAACPANPGF